MHRRPDEFMDYNCMYKGAKAWAASQSGMDKLPQMTSTPVRV
jgi:hypothetical protein